MVRGQFILIKVLEWVGGETLEQFMDVHIGGSKGGPLSVQILSFSCRFREIFGQIVGFCPKNPGVGAPRLGNPGSSTVTIHAFIKPPGY